MESCKFEQIALAIKTAIITGKICKSCPVNSKTITATETVCVTPPVKAAEPTIA
jgi:hypothetical protein